MKAIYYYWIGSPSGTTLQTATGLNRGKVRLLDQGHTFGTFLTREFSNSISRGQALRFKIAVFIMGFLVPAVLLVLSAHEPVGVFVLLAPLSAFIGIGLERFLFFVEAQHVVNLYHGRLPSSMPMMHPVRGGAEAQAKQNHLVPSYDKQ
jgi:DMSO reductase anchor subunit